LYDPSETIARDGHSARQRGTADVLHVEGEIDSPVHRHRTGVERPRVTESPGAGGTPSSPLRNAVMLLIMPAVIEIPPIATPAGELLNAVEL